MRGLLLLFILFISSAKAFGAVFHVKSNDYVEVCLEVCGVGSFVELHFGDSLEGPIISEGSVSYKVVFSLNTELEPGTIIQLQHGQKSNQLLSTLSGSKIIISKEIPILSNIGKKSDITSVTDLVIEEKQGETRHITYKDEEGIAQKGFLRDRLLLNAIREGEYFFDQDAVNYNKSLQTALEKAQEISGTAKVLDTLFPKLQCPEKASSIKLLKEIHIRGDLVDYIPAGSIIEVKKEEKNRCYINVLEVPENSGLALDDYNGDIVTYPSNLWTTNIIEVDRPKEQRKLKPRDTFKINKAKISLIRRRDGKSISITPNDKVYLSGKHKNGVSYIVKLNDKPTQYRVSKKTLDDMARRAQITFDNEQTLKNNLVTQSSDIVVKTPEHDICENCNEEKDVYNAGEIDVEFETCSEGSDYFADNMTPADKDSMLEPKKKKYAGCISKSMQHYAGRKMAPNCSYDEKGNLKPSRIRKQSVNSKGQKYWGIIKQEKKRQCASKKVVTSIADSFVDAAECLGVDPKEAFGTIHHESRFQPGAVSPTFAVGVGQIIRDTYIDFYKSLATYKSARKKNSSSYQLAKTAKGIKGNRSYKSQPSKKRLSRLTTTMASDFDHALSSDSKKCEGLKRMVEKPAVVPKGRSYSKFYDNESRRICSPYNPDESFFISMIYFRSLKKEASDYLYRYALTNGLKIDKSKMDTFSRTIARAMYNGGAGAAKPAISKLFKLVSTGEIDLPDVTMRKRNKKKINSLNDLSGDEFRRYFSYVIRYNHGNPGEVSRYALSIQKDLKQVQGNEDICGH